jgi:hypothetical protein
VYEQLRRTRLSNSRHVFCFRNKPDYSDQTVLVLKEIPLTDCILGWKLQLPVWRTWQSPTQMTSRKLMRHTVTALLHPCQKTHLHNSIQGYSLQKLAPVWLRNPSSRRKSLPLSKTTRNWKMISLMDGLQRVRKLEKS